MRRRELLASVPPFLLAGCTAVGEIMGATNQTGSDVGDSGISESETERLVFEYVNEKRTERLSALEWNDRAANAARSHARDMAENDYFSHTSQDGQTQEERYSFCDGGENAAQTWVFKRVEGSDGSTVYHTSSDELAQGILEVWMNSDPHRERGIYGDWWNSAGVGVAINDDNKVYAVMGFCSS